MKTSITYLLMLMLCLTPFYGVGQLDSDNSISQLASHSETHVVNTASDNASCHQNQEIVQHDCCASDMDATHQHLHEQNKCFHEGCSECGINCNSSTVALLSFVKIAANNSYDIGKSSATKLPPTPYLDQVIPPII